MNDDGFTTLPGGLRLSKADPLLAALGSLDELNAALGLLRARLAGRPDAEAIQAIQRDVVCLGGELAMEERRLGADEISALERATARRAAQAPPALDFVLPGADEASARAHWARAVCRRAERDLVRAREVHPARVSAAALAYLNRLAGLLFAWARALAPEDA